MFQPVIPIQIAVSNKFVKNLIHPRATESGGRGRAMGCRISSISENEKTLLAFSPKLNRCQEKRSF